jgi:propionyl-CoA carboxylase alpha chain
MTANAARMLALMPKKVPPDLSKVPALANARSVARGIGDGRRSSRPPAKKLAVIEAMKMENVLKAERDCKVKKVVAKAGESLSVDQVIIEFE